MPEDMNLEVAHKLAEREQPVRESRRWEEVIEILGVLLLAVAAVSTAPPSPRRHTIPPPARTTASVTAAASRRPCRSIRRGDVPQRAVWLHIAAGPLPLGQRDVLLDQWLVGDLAEQVVDEVEP